MKLKSSPMTLKVTDSEFFAFPYFGDGSMTVVHRSDFCSPEGPKYRLCMGSDLLWLSFINRSIFGRINI